MASPPTARAPQGRPASSAAPPPEAVAPLMRGIAVLLALTDARAPLALSEVERATGLARATVDRIAATLARMGYVRLDGRRVALAPRLMELGNAYLGAARLSGPLGAHADRLAEELDESVSLAVRDGDGIRFVHQATRRRAMSLSFRIGDLLPAERTAPGPLFAAGWSAADWARWRVRRVADPAGSAFTALPPPETAVREEEFVRRVELAVEEGYALDDQLIEPGLVALAVPVYEADGTLACVASVVSHTSRHSAASLRKAMLPRLRATVREMEGELERESRTAQAPARPESPRPVALAAWTGVPKQELGREFVESLARGLTVLGAFGAERPEPTLAAVADATGLARATVRRALITLEHLGYVTAHDRRFRLTPRVLGLGIPLLSRTSLPEIARPHLVELATGLHDSASLAVLAGTEIQYTARIATSRVMSVDIAPGTRFPAYATAMGRVLLAGLPADERADQLLRARPRMFTPHTVTDRTLLAELLDEAAREGCALVDSELEDGLRSVAVPVRDHAGAVVAAVNVAMHSARRTVEQCRNEVLPALRKTAARIEADLHIAGRFARIRTT
ncbi:IclR family transcriptional regulator domain-containing protein [Streptomyces sp. NBC_01264]|uniref:IclR family transcriptional regulator domain-containing protein n=1 Tax=Streptomyces sp. NBC_01264 TaxID=2903804 RepID=UPI0022557D33|nr:IclR family transcriptional regulator C-terminal domain-containing protein [Streptomyces sp. NBC_01264]MCX4782115.1 helix-turn-helix domain-containing protein [Streptomyces sp. NBC_01264]